MLIGICREGQRELCEAASTFRRTELRVLVLDAFDQRTQMLTDLQALAPECEPLAAVHAGWVLHNGKAASESTLLAGEESTLRAAEGLLAATDEPRLRFTLQMHVVLLRTLVSQFRGRAPNIQNV
ncbi:MAG: hypothetical protein SGI92_18540 [Bryobacteraceae bacterium]|nr:hypothetical protein [Bryobacteraceae bacterium]